MVQVGIESENHWRPPKVSASDCVWIKVPGAPVTLQVQKGWPAIIIGAVAADFHAFVEPLRDADSASYTPTNIVNTSNHLNATAADLNWNSHPFKVRGTFNAARMKVIKEIEDFYEGMIFWAGRWNNPVDEMHWQMGYSTWNNPAVGDFIKRKIRPDGFSTFRRGTTPAPITNREKYIRAIIAEGQRLGITPRGIKIALSVALVESNIKIYANSGDPASLQLPYDAIGSDHDSSGIFQQRPPWGSIQCRMDATCSAKLFYSVDNGPGVRGLTKIRDGNGKPYDYRDESRSPGFYAQKVQGSAFPDRYDTRYAEASRLYDQYVGLPTQLEDFLMALNETEQRELLDKTRQLWGALFNPVPSKSRYGNPEDLWPTKNFIQNDDGFLYDLITEHDASLGDAAALARIKKAAAQGDTVAKNFLEKLSANMLDPKKPTQPTVTANNFQCWNCSKRYPDALSNCPFCGATKVKPDFPEPPAAVVDMPGPVPAAPLPVVEPTLPYDDDHTLPSVGQNVVDQLMLLKRFEGELPEEVSDAVGSLIPIIQGLVK